MMPLIEAMKQKPEALKFPLQVLKNDYQTVSIFNLITISRFYDDRIKVRFGKSQVLKKRCEQNLDKMSRFLHKLAISILYSNVIWIKFRKKRLGQPLKLTLKQLKSFTFPTVLKNSKSRLKIQLEKLKIPNKYCKPLLILQTTTEFFKNSEWSGKQTTFIRNSGQKSRRLQLNTVRYSFFDTFPKRIHEVMTQQPPCHMV